MKYHELLISHNPFEELLVLNDYYRYSLFQSHEVLHLRILNPINS